jgi:hypothetical protein
MKITTAIDAMCILSRRGDSDDSSSISHFAEAESSSGDDAPQLTGLEIVTGKPLALRNLPTGTDVTKIELPDK